MPLRINGCCGCQIAEPMVRALTMFLTEATRDDAGGAAGTGQRQSQAMLWSTRDHY